MVSPSVLNVLLSSIAAIVIFVVGYLALLLCAIAGLVLANLIYKAARFFWSHVFSTAVSTNGVSAKVRGHNYIVPYN
jgi:hypothetical protein